MNQIPSADNAILFPLTIVRGAIKRVPMRLKMRGEPVPLAGYTALLQVREEAKSPAVLMELSTENGGIEIDAPTGTVTLIFRTEVTSGFTLPGEYDLMLYDADEQGTRIIYGPCSPLTPVTRKP
jgi:hypothetical protein